MMSTILQTRVFAFIIIYIHSFSFFLALAAPVSVPVTPEISPVQRKRELQDDSGLFMRQNVPFTVFDARINTPTPSYSRVRNPTKSRYVSTLKASTEREPEVIVSRSFFGNIGNAFKKVGGAIKSGVQKVGNGIKNVAQKVGGGVKNAAQKVGNVAKKVGGGIKNVAKQVGNGVKKVAQKVGNGVKKVAQKVGNGVKNVAQKVGNGVKKVAQKVGNGVKAGAKWVKANGAKIAKGGLKVLATVSSVAGRVANFVPIPGVNKMMSKGLKYASAGLDKGSDAIKADLGGFGKAVNVMNKIQHPLSGAGGQVLDAILKRDDVVEEPVFHRDLDYFVEEREFDLDL
jgi:hypothetical protein